MNFNDVTKPYLIGEIGLNHVGDMQLVKRLVDATFATGWDSVKFQKRNPDVCVPESQKSIMRDTPWGRISYIEYKHRIELTKENYDYIDSYCREKPIEWSASVWDVDSLEFITSYDVPYIKIPSALNTDYELLRLACQTKKPLIVSTGMCELEELDEMVNLLSKHSSNFCILHTNSAYPCEHADLNLSLIPYYMGRYGCPVGYSGHERDVEPSVMAVALGAKVVERHITVGHDLWGTDQASSLEPSGMHTLRKRCDAVSVVMGTPKKILFDSERVFKVKLKG